MSRSRSWVIAVIVGGSVLLLGLVGAAVVFWPRTSIVEVHDVPESFAYPDAPEPTAVVYRHYSLASGIGLGSETYSVLMGSGAEHGYGHRVRLSATGGVDPESVTVEWEPEGAWLNYGSGHRVFVPADFFLNGR